MHVGLAIGTSVIVAIGALLLLGTIKAKKHCKTAEHYIGHHYPHFVQNIAPHQV